VRPSPGEAAGQAQRGKLLVNMSAANRIIELLYDRREGYFSHDELAAASGLTRRAICEALD